MIDGNHPLIAGALGAFLRLVHVRPRSAVEALCNLTVGATVAWYGAPFLLRLAPAWVQAEPRSAGLAGLIVGFLSMWLLSYAAGVIQRARGNPFAAFREIRGESKEAQSPPPDAPN